jgi:hypothetical protein
LEGKAATFEADCNVCKNFYRAIELFIKKANNKKKPQDLQYIYMAPGGDHVLKKDLLTPPRLHSHRFKEMLRISGLLPAGDIPAPNKGLALEWYYMLYHKSDRDKYVQSWKILTNETIKTLTKYFQSIFDQKKS